MMIKKIIAKYIIKGKKTDLVESSISDKGYLSGLDALRAFAAMAVILGHIEIIKSINGIPNFLNYYSFKGNMIGHIGVILFFVLSGFLITLLLLRELESKKKIDIKAFYLRRAGRILPLYYTVLLLSTFLTSYIPSILTIVLCFSILPNIAEVTGNQWSVSPQVWSIGVEEQFYLFWPFFIVFFQKHLLKVLVIFFFLWSLLPHFLQWLFIKIHLNNTGFLGDLFIVHGMKFNCMALGGVVAIVFHRDLLKSNVAINLLTKIVAFAIPFLWLGNFNLPYFNDEFYAVLFAILILGISRKTISNIFLIHPISSYLGKISYGLYMYHWLIIILIIPYFKKILMTNSAIGNIIFYVTIILTTISISHFSYFNFEKRFIIATKKKS